jgi:cytoskeletal protein CcmA (bactofilin family)
MSVWRGQNSRIDPFQENELPREKPPESLRVGPETFRAAEPVAHIGKSITIRGDLFGEEDLILDGRIEGRVELLNHHLTIGANSEQIQAELVAKEVTIHGRVAGNVTAKVRVQITESGCLDGNVVAPRLSVREGGQLNGTVTMKDSASVAPARKATGLDPVQTTSQTP